MGARYREVNSKIATAPKFKVEDKDRVNNSRRIKAVKLNIIKLQASLKMFSRGKLVIEVECQTLKLKEISDLSHLTFTTTPTWCKHPVLLRVCPRPTLHQELSCGKRRTNSGTLNSVNRM